MHRAVPGACAVVALTLVTPVDAAPPPARGVELGARVAWNINDQGSFALVGVRVGGRVVPHVGLGAYADAAPFFSPITPKCGGACPGPERPVRAGAYLDLHALPARVVDPWFRFGLGFVRTSKASADVELAVGLDIRHRRLAVGPFVMWVLPFDDALPRKWIGAGVQLSVAL